MVLVAIWSNGGGDGGVDVGAGVDVGVGVVDVAVNCSSSASILLLLVFWLFQHSVCCMKPVGSNSGKMTIYPPTAS